MKMRKLGAHGPLVSAIGLGCMGMSVSYGKRDDAEAVATIHRAVELGLTMLDTADRYGDNEDFLAGAIRGLRDKIFIASKCGFVDNPTGTRPVDGSPAHIHKSVDRSLKRLGVDVIDLYYLHRVDAQTPIEESVGAFADMVKAGKIRYVGLSETTADELRRAHAVHPITALQSEYSLWTRDPEGEILDTCRRLGIGFVPFAPLGKGFLTGTITQTADKTFDSSDLRHNNPRMVGENFEKNKALVGKVWAMAERKGITPGQLALAWVLAQGENIVPIPGTKRRKYLEENLKAADVDLSAAELAEIAALDLGHAVAGGRYSPTSPGNTRKV